MDPLFKITVHFGGLRLPKSSCIGLSFQSVLTLLPKCFAFLWSILHCYMDIATFLIADYTIPVLICIFENMGVVEAGSHLNYGCSCAYSPLVKIFRNHH